MSWFLLAIAALLLWLGVDMLILSKSSAPLPQRETDEMIFGKGHRPISDAARQYIEARILVRSGASTRILGGLFLLLGVVVGTFAIGWP